MKLITCPSCQHKNMDEMSFCDSCGERLSGRDFGAMESRNRDVEVIRSKLKNLKSHNFWLVVSVVLTWGWSFYTDGLGQRITKGEPLSGLDLELIQNDLIHPLGAAISFFFLTMIVVTIQALIYNVRKLETEVLSQGPD